MKERKLIAEMQDTIENLLYIIPVKITDDRQIDDRCRVMAKAHMDKLAKGRGWTLSDGKSLHGSGYPKK
jgi:hypothetical protein